ncbi:hypothetical protein [Candidatus Mycoplasma haematohominis]|uniref:hypothetical protein n=1 Tax=Candidatus Mycoplasma haematohominis TaxID=1494318 RepID=UPI001C0A7615|nr:hypothetical protein [Candidatus Mycoplasma haemohominis]
MSTQAIGAAAAGTAIVGGGGATIAYAAGAFDPKVKESKQEVSTYKTSAEKELETDKEYVGESKDKIKALLPKDTQKTSYQTSLEGVWDKMKSSVKEQTSIGTQPQSSDISDSSKADSVADYVNKWCLHVSNLSLSVVPTAAPDKDRWDAFKGACFGTKEVAQATV